MRIALTLALAMLAVPACKSHNQPEDMQQLKKEAPDAKPMLHVASDDPRYVASAGGNTRQVHYYSVEMDTTYVVDESTGKIVTTYASKEMPGVVVIEKPAYQPPPVEAQKPAAAKESAAPAKEGCGSAEIEVVEETEAVEVEGCKSDDAEGCGDDEAEGCDDDADEEGDDDDADEDEDEEGDDDGAGGQ